VVVAGVLAVDGKATGSRRLSLSLRGSVVNRGLRFEHLLPGGTLYAALASEEDHGWVLSTGLDGVTAFLPKKNIKGRLPVGGLRLGMPLTVIVLAVNEAARALTCGVDDGVATFALTRGALTLSALKPGMLVHGLVDAHLRSGLALSFLQGFQGGVEVAHLDAPYTDSEWKTKMKLGHLCQARVLMVDARSKVIYLTLRPHLLGFRVASSVPEVGSLLEDAVVLKVDGKKGLLLGLPVKEDDVDAREQEEREAKEAKKAKKRDKARRERDGEKEEEEQEGEDMAVERVRYVPIVVHKAQLGEGEAEEEEGEDDEEAAKKKGLSNYRVGETVRCRVIGRSAVEGCAFASLRPSTLHAAFLRLADVKPGTVVKATVEAVEDWGLSVDLGAHIRAHVTNMHLADAPMSGPVAAKKRAKYAVGQSVSVRVLQVDSGKNKVYATLKRSLVKDDGPHLCSYEDATPGRACVGFVTRVESYGLIVTFYANVHGLVPAKVLASQGVEDASAAFKVGSVVRCVVSTCTPATRRMALSLDVSGQSDASDAAAAAVVLPGMRVSGVVERVMDPHVMVTLDKEGGQALLHKNHLGDHATLADALLARVEVGQRIERALVLELKQGSNLPLLSTKPLLLAHGLVIGSSDSDEADTFNVPALRDLSVGTLLVGTVARSEDFGMFVRFLGGQSALAPKANVADHFVTSATGLFGEGDSVRCRVARVDVDKGKVRSFSLHNLPKLRYPCSFRS
jgi:rRNA biogenesis protein RRP5